MLHGELQQEGLSRALRVGPPQDVALCPYQLDPGRKGLLHLGGLQVGVDQPVLPHQIGDLGAAAVSQSLLQVGEVGEPSSRPLGPVGLPPHRVLGRPAKQMAP